MIKDITIQEIFEKITANLSPREKKILNLRWGMSGTFYTLQKTGIEFGVTTQRIRQIEASALEKLRMEYWELSELLKFTWHLNPYRCLCGKYKTKRYRGIVCDKCGVEVQRSQDIIEKLKS